MRQEEAVAAIATPPGKGGIAVIRLSGRGVYGIAGAVFTPENAAKCLDTMPGYTAAYGHFAWEGRPIDDGIALCFRAPHSYTGEDVIELSCHGGEAVSREVLAACVRAGAKPAAPGEFTRRAVLNGRMGLTQAEAVMDLISATGKQGAAVAEAALGGALQKEIVAMKAPLVELAGHLAAWTDYPEEDVEALEEGHFVETVENVENRLSTLIQNYERGSVIRRGVDTAIVGSPNVGKSTLFNLLSGFEHAIVTPVAGTTRDVVRQTVQLGGIVLHLADTAGLHDTSDVVESEGIRRSRREIEKAALVIAVFDGSQPLDAAQRELAGLCRGRAALCIINKSDLGTVVSEAELAPCFSATLVVSAKEENAAERIENAILSLLDVQNVDTDAAMLANQRQLSAATDARNALRDAAAALKTGYSLDAAGVCLEDAIRALATLAGEDATEAVLEEVFSKFCVGK